MKPDPKLYVTIPTAQQCVTEYANVEDCSPATKKRAVEIDPSQLVEEGQAEKVEEEPKTPTRLPSIKHLQLDIGVTWPLVEQYFANSPSSTPQQSPSATPTLTSAPASPSPYLSTPSTPSTPTLTSLTTSKEITAKTPTISRSSSPAAPLVSSSVKLSTSAPPTPNSSHPPPPSMASMMSSYHIPMSPSSFSHPPFPQPPTQEVLVPVVTNNFGFIETTFANTPMKKTHRRRPANVDKSSLYCHNCGAKNTPEWRRGPKGPATLCNACGLAYAKRLRQEEDTTQLEPQEPQQLQLLPTQPQQTLLPVATPVYCACPQAAMYGRCVHVPPPVQQIQVQPLTPTLTTTPVQQQPAPTQHHRPMQMIKGMPVRINSHTFHNYTPPTPHPSLTRAL